jgi:gamma-glutamyltranspeptidase/glutathione hydrolase
MTGGRGLLTATDLETYRVVEREPLRAACGDRVVVTNPPPSFGGELAALMLCLLTERAVDGDAWDAPQRLARLVEVMIEVDQARAVGAVAELLRPRSTGGTTHVSVSDADGNIATMTTSNGETSGYVIPGTGVMLNNMLGEDDLHPDGFHAAPPGQRVASMMSPTIVLEAGQPVLALGSGGSKRIRTAIPQVVAGVLDLGLDLEEAVLLPRLHWDGEMVQVEPGVPAAATEALAERWPVNVWTERSLYFGGVHAVRPGKNAVGDPRRGGAAAVS